MLNPVAFVMQPISVEKISASIAHCMFSCMHSVLGHAHQALTCITETVEVYTCWNC